MRGSGRSGTGAFMNCTAFRQVELYAGERDKTCLPDLLGQTSGELLAILHLPQARPGCSSPPFNEELEDLGPAHIFQRRIEGAGYAYRQCIQNGVLSFFAVRRRTGAPAAHQDYDTACRVALLRLRWPVGLGAQARAAYLDCLHAHAQAAVRGLLEVRDCPAYLHCCPSARWTRADCRLPAIWRGRWAKPRRWRCCWPPSDRTAGRAAPCRQKTYDL